MDGVMTNKGSGPWRKQREPMAGRDGMLKQGEQHNEHKSLEGSLPKVAKFLDRADSMDDYRLRPGTVKV
jgi:hypothetical protein